MNSLSEDRQLPVWEAIQASTSGRLLESTWLGFDSSHGYSNPLLNAAEDRNRSVGALLRYYLAKCPFTSRMVLDSDHSNQMQNDHFLYQMIRPAGVTVSNGAVILLHGLNEKHWDKYMPWAGELAVRLNRAVILFPLAYHMNRAPALWSDPRAMRTVVSERRSLFPDLKSLSFANAALSQRLQFAPDLFLRSGLQSLEDLRALVTSIRQGCHAAVQADGPVDFFAYSIGATLAQAAIMSDDSGLFQGSRAVLFCGGARLSLANPESKAILDSEASMALKSLTRSPGWACSLLPRQQRGPLRRLLMGGSKSGIWHELDNRTAVLGFEHDAVFPGEALRHSFAGTQVAMDILKTSEAVRHEKPFDIPGDESGNRLRFERVMQSATDFLH